MSDPQSVTESPNQFDQFRRIVENSPNHLWTATPDGTIDYVNPAMTTFYARSAGELIAGGWREGTHPADLAPSDKAWRQAVETGQSYEAECRLRRGADGLYLWYRIKARPIRNESGQITGWVGVNVDINTLKRSVEVADARQEMAQRERERLMRAFRYAPAVVALYSGPQHVISMANPQWEAFTGRPEAIGKPAREAFPDIDDQGIFEIMDRVYETGEPFQATEMRVMYDRDGDGQLEETYWNLVLQPLNGAGEPVSEVLSHAVEVTDLVIARHSADTLRQEIAQMRQ